MKKTLLKPKTFAGERLEYTINDSFVTITDSRQNDQSRRRIDIPLDGLGRFISELCEVERRINEGV